MAVRPVKLKIKFKSESLGQFVDRYSIDVSRGGIFIRTKNPLEVGTKIKFEFLLQNASPLMDGEGTVVWIREHDPSRKNVAPGMGVRFDVLSPESEKTLQEILRRKDLPKDEALAAAAADREAEDNKDGEAASAVAAATDSSPEHKATEEKPAAESKDADGADKAAASETSDEQAASKASAAGGSESEGAGTKEPEQAETGVSSAESIPDKVASDESSGEDKKAASLSGASVSEGDRAEPVHSKQAETTAAKDKDAKPDKKATKPVAALAEEEEGGSLWVVVTLVALVAVVALGYVIYQRTKQPAGPKPPSHQVAAVIDAGVPAPQVDAAVVAVDAAPARPACALQTVPVTTVPPKVTVLVDGVPAGGVTPTELCLKPGSRHSIELKKSGYFPVKLSRAKVRPGFKVNETLKVTPYSVLVRTNPKGAAVFLDGKPYGCHSTCNVELAHGSAGPWVIIVKRNGYEPASFTVRRDDPGFKLDRYRGYRLREYIKMVRRAAPASAWGRCWTRSAPWRRRPVLWRWSLASVCPKMRTSRASSSRFRRT